LPPKNLGKIAVFGCGPSHLDCLATFGTSVASIFSRTGPEQQRNWLGVKMKAYYETLLAALWIAGSLACGGLLAVATMHVG
jgi:hypothetical protein